MSTAYLCRRLRRVARPLWPDSRLFFVIPGLVWFIQRARPDIVVHFVVENASSMRGLHKSAIMEALGGVGQGVAVQATDPGTPVHEAWTRLPRERFFFDSMPVDRSCPRLNRRALTWGQGWRPRWDGNMLVIMRTHGAPPEVRASTYQYHPRHLLHSKDPELGWQAGQLTGVIKRIRNLLPRHLHIGDRILCQCCPRGQEELAIPVARWIYTHGPRRGFRIPNAVERARATGRGACVMALGLDECQLYDAGGNRFDPDALIMRIGPTL